MEVSVYSKKGNFLFYNPEISPYVYTNQGRINIKKGLPFEDGNTIFDFEQEYLEEYFDIPTECDMIFDKYGNKIKIYTDLEINKYIRTNHNFFKYGYSFVSSRYLGFYNKNLEIVFYDYHENLLSNPVYVENPINYYKFNKEYMYFCSKNIVYRINLKYTFLEILFASSEDFICFDICTNSGGTTLILADTTGKLTKINLLNQETDCIQLEPEIEFVYYETKCITVVTTSKIFILGN